MYRAVCSTFARRLSRATVWVAVLLLSSAAPVLAQPAPDPDITHVGDRLDPIVEWLEQDPVYVDRGMGNGDADAVRDLLRDESADLPFPTYVVLVHHLPGDDLPRRPDDPYREPHELAVLLHSRLGEDGLYVVGVDQSVGAIARGLDGIDTEHVSWAVSDAVRGNDYARMFNPAGEARAYLELAPVVGDDYYGPAVETAVNETTAKLSGDTLMTNTVVHYNRYEVERELTDIGQPSATPENAVGIGLVVAIVVAAGVNVLLNWRAARREAVGAPTDVTDARRRLDKALATVDSWDPAHHRAAHTPGDIHGDPTAGDRPHELETTGQWEHVWKAADAARLLRTSTDAADLVGAMVLAQHAARTGQRLRQSDGDEDLTMQRPCFFNPLHGQGAVTAAIPDGPGISVPVCRRCSAAVAGGDRPDTLMIKDGLKVVPYYRRHDVWSVTGFGALRDDVVDLVLAGARAGTNLPSKAGG